MTFNIAHVVGARPNYMKVAPVMRSLATYQVVQRLVDTGQHYDDSMAGRFIRDLGLGEPDVHLGVGSGSHASQTARIMIEFETWLERNSVQAVLVVGDVNSTLAGAIVAAKAGIPVVHVEAGLRSRDRSMPEEINRLLTDQLSMLCLCPSEDAAANLLAEGVDPSRIDLVGNVMIDSLMTHLPAARDARVADRLGLPEGSYALVTLHRPSNVDRVDRLRHILQQLNTLAESMPIVFPLHPRTQASVERFGVMNAMTRIRVTKPLGYVEMLSLMESARVVITDSGGVQEETTVLGVPCLTLRENTERPITVSEGTNRLVHPDGAELAATALEARRNGCRTPRLWDGHAGERAAASIARKFCLSQL
ncbi:MAG: UDP-N-acetylglucosamine 2-epimerase [Gemmatimonadetes bacterium 13_1_40CM_2_60_3]|nr:MAG: UDP-N-acetylglucosamine 2-epimerase [Gemmatimonadetes bacterium 13_1_40CM_2_60_3]